ncbi:hypothetical protein EXE30_00415 [Acinetobacter halotolerans]|uniref:Lipoprotein n=1 Tax=Acinetobacter halotolerans TaxID=1752076 RepID=A0A4Q6XCG6_9GAMM|nr:hypothetical protein [Acinetobacter halotolerans]RZF56758.1 hypothetical protein EXE30_00415 [Acinetobacter halotolerans]
MKNIYILIFISTLIACSDKSQDKIQDGLNNEQKVMHTEVHEQPPSVASEALAVDETKEGTDKIVTTEKTDQTAQISCFNKNITEWYGFDEASAEPKCEAIKNFKLPSYKCDVSKNAFGDDKDAILVENQNQRIFVYSNSKYCNEMLDIRNSNAP